MIWTEALDAQLQTALTKYKINQTKEIKKFLGIKGLSAKEVREEVNPGRFVQERQPWMSK